MNERIMQFRVGVMILATMIITAILILLFVGNNPMVHGTYKIYIRFTDAPGITKYTPIRKAGIRIGRVTDIKFENFDTVVVVTAEIDKDRHLYHNEACEAVNSLITGDATLDFVRAADPNAPKVPIEAGETIEGGVAEDATHAIASLQGGVSKTLASVALASQDMHVVLTRFDRLLQTNEQSITHIINQADDTLALLQKTLISSNDILGDAKLRDDIKKTIAQLPEVLKQTQSTIGQMGDAITSLNNNLKNIEGLTKPLGERGEVLVERIDAGTAKLNHLMDELLGFSRSLNSSQGTVGQLLNDPDLYQHISKVIKNLEQITREVQPIIANANSFTDKISRHPSALLKGALKKEDPGLN